MKVKKILAPIGIGIALVFLALIASSNNNLQQQNQKPHLTFDRGSKKFCMMLQLIITVLEAVYLQF